MWSRLHLSGKPADKCKHYIFVSKCPWCSRDWGIVSISSLSSQECNKLDQRHRCVSLRGFTSGWLQYSLFSPPRAAKGNKTCPNSRAPSTSEVIWYWDEVNSLVSKCKRHILEGRDLFLLHDSMINLGRSSGSLGSEPECLAKGRGFSDHKPINPMSMTCEKVQLKPPRFSTHSVLLGGNIHIIYFPFEVWHVESLRHGPRFWFHAKHLDGGVPVDLRRKQTKYRKGWEKSRIAKNQFQIAWLLA